MKKPRLSPNPPRYRATRKRILRILAHAEQAFGNCWDILAALKSASRKADSLQALPRFQPELAEAILRLTRMRDRVVRERRAFVANKARLDHRFFRRQMLRLRSFEGALDEALAIARTLGDSFAWFFYHRDQPLLIEHAKHERVRYMPTGVGGFSEVLFVDGMRMLREHFVLYHGTTTILRLGDVSLVDMRSLRVAALGEMKSAPVRPGEMSINLILVGPAVSLFADASRKVTPAREKPEQQVSQVQAGLQPKGRERVKRQVKTMSDAIGPSKDPELPGSPNLYGTSYADSLVTLAHETPAGQQRFQLLEPGLILGVLSRRDKTLAAKVLPRGRDDEVNRSYAEVDPLLPGLMAPNSKHNSLRVGNLHYGPQGPEPVLGLPPIFWWLPDIHVARGLILQDVHILTVFNPAHMLDDLERRGFEILRTPDGDHRLLRRFGSKTLEIEHLDYFLQLVPRGLIASSTVVAWLTSMFEDLAARDIKGPAKISLNLQSAFPAFVGRPGDPSSARA